jgi:catechol 2,3-dioxygenase-like lactoylglutathione lyase family enzyme
MRFAHTNIISSDWKSLVDFYVKTFNCVVVPPIRKQSGKWLDDGVGLDDAQLEGAHLLLPGYGENGPTLEIYQYNSMEKNEFQVPNRKGFGHIAFEVENVKSKVEDLIRNNGTIYGKITKKVIQGKGEITFVYAKDPEGNLIELQSWKNV